MINYTSFFFSFLRWTSILGGLLLVVSGGFYFFNVSAQSETDKKPEVQNLVIGKLAFTSVSVPSSGNFLITSNANGSGRTLVPVSKPSYPKHPAWSPDGTKIAFFRTDVI